MVLQKDLCNFSSESIGDGLLKYEIHILIHLDNDSLTCLYVGGWCSH